MSQLRAHSIKTQFKSTYALRGDNIKAVIAGFNPRRNIVTDRIVFFIMYAIQCFIKPVNRKRTGPQKEGPTVGGGVCHI